MKDLMALSYKFFEDKPSKLEIQALMTRKIQKDTHCCR